MTVSNSSSLSSAICVHDDVALTSCESAMLDNRSSLHNFEGYAKYSTPTTQLFFAKVCRDDEFLGLAPVMRLVKLRSTRLIRKDKRKWIEPILGPFAKKTTYMVDSAFLGFDTVDPFFCPDNQNAEVVRSAVLKHLQNKKDAEIVWLAQPSDHPPLAPHPGYDCFPILPMVHVNLTGHETAESYIAALDRKRRQNWRADRRVFAENGGSFAKYASPIPPPVLEQMHSCLRKSADQNELFVPFEDLMNSKSAFFAQNQETIVALFEGRVIGFFSFIANGNVLQQCHGGFDYANSHNLKAYANLINMAIEHGITHGFERLTMGPLNNETKRRAGSDLMPMIASIWCRDAVTRFFMRKLFVRNFQVFQGTTEA